MKLECYILNRRWEVTVCRDLDEIGANGRTLFPTRELEVSDKLTYPEMEHILTHELTHAYMNECGYQQLDSRDIPMSQEFFCEFMAIHGETIIDQSKELMKVIKKENKKKAK